MSKKAKRRKMNPWVRLWEIFQRKQVQPQPENSEPVIDIPTVWPVEPEVLRETDELLGVLIQTNLPAGVMVYKPHEYPLEMKSRIALEEELYRIGDPLLLCAWESGKLPPIRVSWVIDLDQTLVVGGRMLVYKPDFVSSVNEYGKRMTSEQLAVLLKALVKAGVANSVREVAHIYLMTSLKCVVVNEVRDGKPVERHIWQLDLPLRKETEG